MLRHDYHTTKDTEPIVKNIYEGVVTSIVNGNNGTIQVRVEELDGKKKTLPNCYPLFNYTFFKVLPKVGERVTLLLRKNQTADNTLNQDIRYWSAIVHGSPEQNGFEDYYKSDFKEDGFSKTSNRISYLLPQNDEIGMIGKNNTQLRMGDEYLHLSAGYHDTSPFTANEKNPSSLFLSYKDALSMLSGEKVFLVANANNDFKTASDKLLPSPENIEALLNCEPVPYGTKLTEFLKLMREILINHVHPYSAMKPVQDYTAQQLLNFDLNSILNKNVLTG